MYAALEKAYKALLIAAFTGHHPGVGAGMLEDGKTMCPVQLLIERDMARAVAQLFREINLSDEELALSVVDQVGIGLTENYLATDHTALHFRTSCWLPELIDRSGWKGAATEQGVLQAAQDKLEQLLGQYEKPEGREEALGEMREVIERARKKL